MGFCHICCASGPLPPSLFFFLMAEHCQPQHLPSSLPRLSPLCLRCLVPEGSPLLFSKAIPLVRGVVIDKSPLKNLSSYGKELGTNSSSSRSPRQSHVLIECTGRILTFLTTPPRNACTVRNFLGLSPRLFWDRLVCIF